MRLIGEGKGEPALAAVRRDMAKNPGSPQAKALEIRLLLMMGRIDDALKITEAALKREPGNADLVYQHGIEQMARKDLPAAEKDLRHALQINPQHTAAMNDLAVLLLNQGKRAEAQGLLEQVLRINPQDQMAAANLRALQSGVGERQP